MNHLLRDNSNRTYVAWRNMISRCHNIEDISFIYYGARGIKVCAEWRDSFEQFVLDMGPAPEGFTLDREKTNEGYSKENCRWATMTTQVRNRRLFSKNKSGVSGVWFDAKRGQWQVKFNSKMYGWFYDFFLAVCKRKSLEHQFNSGELV